MVDGPVSKRKLSRRARRKIVIAGVGLLLVLIAGFVGWKFNPVNTGPQQAQSVDNPALAAAARLRAQTVAEFFEVISADLSAYASSRTTRDLFLSDDDDLLNQEAETAVSRFNSALKLRLLRPDQYQLDNDSSPPLSFGSIAILNKAVRTAGAVATEVLLFGTGNQHIVMVGRVKDQADQLIGVVHLSLDVDLFRQALSGLDSAGAFIEIVQNTAGDPPVLGSIGEPGFRTGEPGTSSISGTRWSLAYWGQPNPTAAVTMPSLPGGIPILPLAMGILVLGLVVFLFLRRKAPAADISLDKPDISYAGAIKAIMDGAHPGMEKLVSHMPGRQGPATFSPGISEGMQGGDITGFMKLDDIKAAAESGEVFDITQASKGPAEKQAPPKNNLKTDSPKAADTVEEDVEIPEIIFRKYDIRGIVDKNLTAKVVEKIGLAVGSEANDAGLKTIVVGRDGRNSSPDLAASLISGLRASGRDVIDIGVVPTPVLYFATHHLETGSGVMVTGSHNGPEYNGLKIVLGGITLSEDSIMGLYQRIQAGNFITGSGNLSSAEVIQEYIRRITDDIPVALSNPLKLVVDCGNGAASVVASQLFRAMGHDVIELYCELDGNFPNHHPDPSQPENLAPMISKVKEVEADLGFAFDGDGDRLGVVDGNGNVLWPDRQMMVFARDVLSRNQGAEIIFDVKCSSHLKKIIESSGGKPLMWKTGHSLIKSKMKEVGAPLAGEMSGHIFFAERWYGFDDALYSGARMLEILMNAKIKPAEFFADLPGGVSTPELRIKMPEAEHQAFMSRLESMISFEDAKIVTIDGFRVEFSDGWGLIRPSNTSPCLIARFEADNDATLARIQANFKKLLQSIKPDLVIPF